MQIKPLIIVSSFAGYPNRIALRSTDQSPARLMQLMEEAPQDHERFLSALENVWAEPKIPCLYASVAAAVSIQDQFADVPITSILIVPDSVEDYFAAMTEQTAGGSDRIQTVERACSECDLVWKFHSVVSASSLRTPEDLYRIAAAERAFSGSFDILSFREGLTAYLSRLLSGNEEGL